MILKLRPGEEITPARLNQVIDAVNAAHITSSDFPLERTTAGTKLKMPRTPEDFYARIVETEGRERDSNDAVKDGEYEWKEAYLPGPVGGVYPPQEFEDYPEGAGRESTYHAGDDLLFDPAYELSNDRTVAEGTLVRMRVYPGVYDDVNGRGFLRRYVFTYAPPRPLLLARADADWEENGTYPEGNPRIRCHQLITDPYIPPSPTIPYPKIPTGEPIWVELPRERDGGRKPGGAGLGVAHSADPALYSGDRFYYSIDDQGRLICQSPYLHMGKIGEIRMLGMTSTGDPEDEIPVGWHECNGVTKTGNAGDITVANFAREHPALGGTTDLYGAIPRHPSSDHEVNEDLYAHVFDGIGEAGGQFHLPSGEGSALTTPSAGHTHNIRVEQGEYPVCIVFFLQRYA